MKRSLAVAAAVLVVGLADAARGAGVKWVGWSDEVFERAKREKKLVILDLEAVWCHWCHVMEETTYADRDVQKMLGEKFICVRVDQDSRPDLANRYEDYGWPATVVFKWDGQELIKRRGYINPQQMKAMLRAVVKDPTPGPSVVEEAPVRAGDGTVPAEVRERLMQRIEVAFDPQDGGWGTDDGHRFVDADTVEYCLMSGNPKLREMATRTLTGALKITDPVWGGLYQYSTDGDWDHPHFERIMSAQSEGMRVYARAYAITGDEKYRAAAEGIARFLRTFLRSEAGAFYTSMDADVVRGEHSEGYFKLDDAGRRKVGIPRIDRKTYARENGWVVSGLVGLWAGTGEGSYLEDAKRAMEWVVGNRKGPAGGYRHGEDSMVFLGDNVAVARGMMDLYTATGERKWLAGAEEAVGFISRTFKGEVGYVTAGRGRPQFEENVMLARVANLLWHHTGKGEYRAVAEHAMKYAGAGDVAIRRGWAAGGVLMADAEMGSEPVHMTVVGAKGDEAAAGLFEAAARWPVTYKRVEWWDRAEGPLPRMEVEYPNLKAAAGFLCTGTACSAPARTAGDFREKMGRATGVMVVER